MKCSDTTLTPRHIAMLDLRERDRCSFGTLHWLVVEPLVCVELGQLMLYGIAAAT